MALAVDFENSDLEKICRCRCVRSLEAFGSAVRKDFNSSTSDLDLLVEFHQSKEATAFENYFGLREDLESFFGRPIDLVIIGALRNPHLRAEVERDRTLLYAA